MEDGIKGCFRTLDQKVLPKGRWKMWQKVILFRAVPFTILSPSYIFIQLSFHLIEYLRPYLLCKAPSIQLVQRSFISASSLSSPLSLRRWIHLADKDDNHTAELNDASLLCSSDWSEDHILVATVKSHCCKACYVIDFTKKKKGKENLHTKKCRLYHSS